MATLPVTVVETDEFLRQAKAVFSTAEADALKTFLAYDPTAGVVMRGTGGVRKLRWATRGRGKRGGARVIYYFHSAALPVFLFAVYVKAAKKDLTEAQRNELRNIVAGIPKRYRIKP